jgi:hypothetical protein
VGNIISVQKKISAKGNGEFMFAGKIDRGGNEKNPNGVRLYNLVRTKKGRPITNKY